MSKLTQHIPFTDSYLSVQCSQNRCHRRTCLSHPLNACYLAQFFLPYTRCIWPMSSSGTFPLSVDSTIEYTSWMALAYHSSALALIIVPLLLFSGPITGCSISISMLSGIRVWSWLWPFSFSTIEVNYRSWSSVKRIENSDRNSKAPGKGLSIPEN